MSNGSGVAFINRQNAFRKQICNNHIKYTDLTLNVAYYLVFIMGALINQISKCSESTQGKIPNSV
jgi:hypothetical protein